MALSSATTPGTGLQGGGLVGWYASGERSWEDDPGIEGATSALAPVAREGGRVVGGEEGRCGRRAPRSLQDSRCTRWSPPWLWRRRPKYWISGSSTLPDLVMRWVNVTLGVGLYRGSGGGDWRGRDGRCDGLTDSLTEDRQLSTAEEETTCSGQQRS